MRLAILSIAALLIACSEGSDSRSGAGTVVSVLPGGTDCRVADHRFACSEAARQLRNEMHVGYADRITVVTPENDRLAAARQTIVAYELQAAGFKHVEVINVGFITEPASKP